ncbi:MAG TPA: hypothetical protein VE913_23935 [Longimicrobium sp.]|nr:hypothetical protein [Longimicrobium sp.]
MQLPQSTTNPVIAHPIYTRHPLPLPDPGQGEWLTAALGRLDRIDREASVPTAARVAASRPRAVVTPAKLLRLLRAAVAGRADCAGLGVDAVGLAATMPDVFGCNWRVEALRVRARGIVAPNAFRELDRVVAEIRQRYNVRDTGN